ncbi:MAG TPA: chemotaxis protein CheW [Verrucomicrobiae bacterium]
MNGHQCLGIIRIGGVDIAVPAENLQEVCRFTGGISPLPDTEAFVVGTALFHGRPVPVIDLPTFFGQTVAAADKPALLVTLHSDHGRCAIFADQVVRVDRPTDDAFVALATLGGKPAIFTRLFTHGAHTIKVLDMTALAAVPGMKFAARNETDDLSQARHDLKNLYPVFQVGAYQFALNIQHVSGTKLVPALAGDNLPGTVLHGFYEERGRHTALCHLPAILELPSERERVAPRQMLVVQDGPKLMAIGITRICGMIQLTQTDLAGVAGNGLAWESCYAGSTRNEQYGEILVLNGRQLLDHPSARSLVTLHTQTQAAQTDNATDNQNYIVYTVGRSLLATPIAEIEAVTDYQPGHQSIRQGASEFAGFFAWHQQMIPLVDLGTLLGYPQLTPDQNTAKIILSAGPGGLRGFLVGSIRSLRWAAPKKLTRHGPPNGVAPELPVPTEMIAIREANRTLNAVVLALKKVGTASAAPASSPRMTAPVTATESPSMPPVAAIDATSEPSTHLSPAADPTEPLETARFFDVNEPGRAHAAIIP